MEFWEHPNYPTEAERSRRKRYYWDKVIGGDVFVIKDRGIHEEHFTKIGNKTIKVPSHETLQMRSA